MSSVHLAVTWYLVGLVWFVQLVHYPMLTGNNQFHRRRTGYVVAPAMLAEAGTAAWLAIYRPAWFTWTGAGLVALIWASTFLIQVPLHARLERAYDVQAQRKLVNSNWIRTAAWSVRGVLLLLTQ